MNKKVLIAIATLLIVFLGINRLIFHYKLKEFKVSIKKYEKEQLVYFKKEKEKRIKQLEKLNLESTYTKFYNESLSLSEKDTVLNFLYIRKSIKVKKAQIDYLDCVFNKCILEKKNETFKNQILLRENELREKYKDAFDQWYPKFKDSKLIATINKDQSCEEYAIKILELISNEVAWYEFEKFLIAYSNETEKAKMENEQAEQDYLKGVSTLWRKVNPKTETYLNDKLSKTKQIVLRSEIAKKEYESTVLGKIRYEITKTTFNKNAFQIVAEDVMNEQWKSNSLTTGRMPYSNCYGSSNYCETDCSEIMIETSPLGSDILVLIKNQYGRVVRHGYIQSGRSFRFNIPDGKYQVFFYSGKGWNPNKKMPSGSCNNLIGGFVEDESVTKDDYITLEGQIVTYQLTLQINGNFKEKASSKDEAF